jgi:hypothetical protein
VVVQMRSTARSAVGSVALVVVAVVSAMVLALTATMQVAIHLTASTALIVPGTGTPNPDVSTNYRKNAVNYYVNPSWSSIDPCVTQDCGVGVPYTAQFWPFPFAGWGGLEGAKWNDSVQNGVVSLAWHYGEAQGAATDPGDEVVIFGYSQGATVASIVKRQLADPPEGVPGLPDNVRFVLIGNPNRPNGGLFERLAVFGTVPILDATFGQPTPTDTSDEVNTTDFAFQYDGVADFPAVPWNLLAVLNAAAGFDFVHGTYLDPRGRPDPEEGELPYGYDAADIENAIKACQLNPSGANCQRHGDTVYVTMPATSLPLLQPFINLGASTGTSWLINPLVALIQPLTQTLIETAYIRDDYGNPRPFTLIPRVNPIKLVVDLINDIPEGINAAIATINDPDHKIPDLPPVWGNSSATTVQTLVQDTDVETPAQPEQKAPTTESPKTLVANRIEDADGLEETAAPADPAKTTRRLLNPAKELEKAVQRVSDRVAERATERASARAERTAERAERLQSRFSLKRSDRAGQGPDKAADKPAERPAADAA